MGSLNRKEALWQSGAVAGTMRIFLRALVAAAALCRVTAFVHPAGLVGPPARRGRPLQAIPIQSVVLGLLAAQSVRDLVIEVPRLGGESADWIGVVIDAGFLGFAGKTLLTQTGVVDATAATADRTVEGLKCTVTVNVGREPNTWMPKDWAASGARLLLPLDVEFADERVDLGFPGEEALGGRYCKRLNCGEAGSFVGRDGRVDVACDGGGWTAAPTGRAGEYALRFFLDFPEAAARNDVEMPAGRIFFSTAAFEEAALDPEMAVRIPPGDVFAAPSGVKIVRNGGLTIKENSWKNGFGAFGDVNLILGRFNADVAKEEPRRTD